MSRRQLLAGGLAAGAVLTLGACGDETGGDADSDAPDSDRPSEHGSDDPGARVLLTRWATDPFALGSYSFLPVGATPDDRLALQAPVSGRIVLAGEHTDVDAPATTHGALASGRRAATLLLGAGVQGPVIVVGAGLAGLGAARALTDAGMPVVVLTRYSGPLDLLRGALSGCDTYLVKPVTLQTLRETVARCLRKSLSSISRASGSMVHA
jgi:CheY-like chemotaxis protein